MGPSDVESCSYIVQIVYKLRRFIWGRQNNNKWTSKVFSETLSYQLHLIAI